MAKTIQQLSNDLDRARNAYKRAQDNLTIAHDAYVKAQKAEEAKTALDLAGALEANVASGWNERGDAFLTQLSWKGAWKGTGLRGGNGHWQATMQNCLQVAVNHQWPDAKLDELAELVEGVVELIRPGVFEGTLKLTSKGSSVDAAALQVLDIRDHTLSESNDWKLGRISATEWVVFDGYNVGRSWGRAVFTGSLLDCLKEIRQWYWYEGGVYEEDDN